MQAFARRKVVLVLCLEIEPKFFNLVIVTLLLWRIPHLYVQFHLWEKKKIIVSISCEFLSILCLEIEPSKFFNPRRHNCDLALIPRLYVQFRFWKRKKERNNDPCLHLVQARGKKYRWFCVSKSSRSSPKFFNLVIVTLLLWRIFMCNFTFKKKKEIALVDFVFRNRADPRPNFSTLVILLL